MRHLWVYLLCPLLLHGAKPSPTQELDTLPTGPKPFPSSHYSLIQEYSPFVKSMESAKETEKSPDLVVVGYGRMKGEDQVIVQQKENSEKREKIGNRFGSKDFPYRLFAVTNAYDRKAFVAVLEDRNKKKISVRYASEGAAPAGGGAPPGGTNPAAAVKISAPISANPGGPSQNIGVNPSNKEDLLQKIEDQQAKINAASDSATKERHQRWLNNFRKQLEDLDKTPVDLETPEVTPPPQP